MVKTKKGMPEDSELVLCTVTKVYPHCVFVSIDDYENRQGMIHISEISPGRIRNINDFVRLGKKVVCKVLSINMEKGNIDLSLRRVSEGQKKEKAEQIKREQKSEKIVEFVAETLKLDKEKLYNELIEKTEEDYVSLHDFFEDYISEPSVLDSLNLPKKVHDKLSEVIHQRIKPPEAIIEGEIKLASYGRDGVSVIKEILTESGKVDESVSIKYKGGGSYSVVVVKDNFKDADKVLEGIRALAEKKAKEGECEFSFSKMDKKQQKKAAA